MGIDTSTKYIIAEAKRKGLYTILTDNLPLEASPLKTLADEAWFFDVGEIDELEKCCRENHVTAVMAGNHEFCLDCTMALCKRLNLPFYASDTCWGIGRNKVLFKKKCRESGLPVAKDYTIDDEITYPVCVKPSDSCAQRGISMVYDEEHLQAAYEKALAASANKKIIIEQLLKGHEITLIGYMDQGDCHLLVVGESLQVICSGKPVVCVGPHSPRLYTRIRDQYGDRIRALLRSMDHQNGLFILQGFMEGNGELYLIESGMRFEGSMSSYLAGRVYDVNPVGWMIDLARGIKPEIDWSKVNLADKEKYFAGYFIYSNPGKIAEIQGLEEIMALPQVEFILERFKAGDTVYDVGNMTQIAYGIHMIAKSPEEMVELLKTINNTLRFIDKEGNSLLIYADEYDEFMKLLTR